MRSANFSSFAFLSLIYGPIKLFARTTKFSPVKVLLISKNCSLPLNIHNHRILVRIFLSLLAASCWRFLQKRISFNFGSRVAFLFFLSEIFNWTSLNQSSRFIESNLIRSIGKIGYYIIKNPNVVLVLLALGLFIEKKFLLSLSLVSLTLPVLKESSLNFLSSFLPLFLNRELFEKDPLAMFSFLSISGIVTAINPHPEITSNYSILKSPTALISAFTVLSGLILRNFFILKLSFVYLIGNFLFERSFRDSLYSPFIAIAFALSFSQFSSKDKGSKFMNPKLESIGIKLFSVFMASMFLRSCFKSIELSPAGRAGLRLNDLLISESESCRIHVSKTAQALGFSKFSKMKHPNVTYEFGTIYNAHEMLQKFKYCVADINESFDPAYWRVRRVIKGISSVTDQNSKLHVKILARIQAE